MTVSCFRGQEIASHPLPALGPVYTGISLSLRSSWNWIRASLWFTTSNSFLRIWSSDCRWASVFRVSKGKRWRLENRSLGREPEGEGQASSARVVSTPQALVRLRFVTVVLPRFSLAGALMSEEILHKSLIVQP